MALREMLGRILDDHPKATAEKFAGHVTAHFIRREAPEAVRKHVDPNYIVEGSAGRANWAETPWIAILDPLVTNSTQAGFYIVYLFNSKARSVSLSINQGVTAVEKEFGSGKAQRDILRARAAVMQQRLEPTFRFPANQISLSEATPLSKAYQWGHVSGFEYQGRSLPSETILIEDLSTAIKAYQTLVEKNGYVLEEENNDAQTVEERRQLRMHERIERVSASAKKVKQLKGFVCEVCGFDFEETYGSLGHEFIEAHHLVPIASLDAGASRKVDLRKDFAVLCANCHRMAHRLDDPSQLSVLKANINSES
ncbi:DUF3578 domain-containing protein [Martelella mediterranea]|uniref:MrcB family domain-containing protein n=1 Tax=Martelella mediterranea TaxID=293089 RepID=UPI001E538A85|nr:DUF3578 domain-containing protein [Martelella mediterranea]MCD1634505.1 DUF3578 domain-containing protein [Martelella mediterranea]